MIDKYASQNGYTIFLMIVVLLHCSALNAKTRNFECALKSHGLSNHLNLTESDDGLINFDYIATSILDAGPPYPSCSINASIGGSESTWNKSSTRYLVKLNDSANKEDKIIIKRTTAGYTFDFGAVSPMNCGQSSGIAEKISLKFNTKKCQVHKLRN